MTAPHARPIRPFNDAPETQAEADVAYASHARPDAFRRIETRNGPLFEDSTTGRVLTADEMEPEPMNLDLAISPDLRNDESGGDESLARAKEQWRQDRDDAARMVRDPEAWFD